MTRINTAAMTLCLLGALPMAASAQSTNVGPEMGDREFSLSGSGSSDQGFNSGSFSVSGDLGWYMSDNLVAGVRQSLNYASISGETFSNDFWNGSTRGYVNYQFLNDSVRPFVGGSLGGVYGDGVQNSAFAGLETGIKYYVQPKTYFLGRVDYQFLFTSASDASDSFQDDGSWAYTVGLGHNF